MKKIKYSIICEDDAQKLFVETIVTKMEASHNVDFAFEHSFYKQFKANSSKQVLINYPQAIDQSFLPRYLLDLVIVGIDFDDRPKDQFEHHYKNLYEKLAEKSKAKTVILFPVQAIEHWLLFIKKRKENPTLIKSFSVDIEKINRKQAKLDIDPNRKTKDQTSAELLMHLDIDWLQQQSKALGRFIINWKHLSKIITNNPNVLYLRVGTTLLNFPKRR